MAYARVSGALRATRRFLLTSSVVGSMAYTCGALGAQPAPGDRPVYTACPEVSCKSKEELAAMFGQYERRKPRMASTAASTSASTGAVGVRENPKDATSSDEAGQRKTCPLDREALGNAAWGFLHTVGAYYPDDPSQQQKDAAMALVTALKELYPCVHCRAQLQIDIASNPPRVANRKEFSLWLCEQHNAVNALLGKPAFDCRLESLDARWRTGSADCWIVKDQTAEESLGQTADDE